MTPGSVSGMPCTPSVTQSQVTFRSIIFCCIFQSGTLETHDHMLYAQLCSEGFKLAEHGDELAEGSEDL